MFVVSQHSVADDRRRRAWVDTRGQSSTVPLRVLADIKTESVKRRPIGTSVGVICVHVTVFFTDCA